MSVERISEEIERLVSMLLREGGKLGEPPGSQLTSTQSLALRTLVDAGSLRLGALARSMQTTDATATRAVDALEAAGYARRTADPDDQRGVRVQATPKGARVVAARRSRRAKSLEAMLVDRSPSELEHLADLLSELTSHLARADGAEPFVLG
jgi:DNA-binding MarR family transcriptional regulator